ncbi:amino acid ABC transporter substrate-binding protein [Accumulibacter sp.]|uniref:amino acid ABC transporter substrate-binding protein n=1 Tax=Accumulibacter sp. TaxID=2053492 RepID=UPI0025FA7E1F|nr:amino acid ABC transporter substrate-binding protein [Accumulibacter sp.]MCM8627492.1 amino acid ABC transporter substrate-binding protein [Accumulibacter sp.]
MKLAVRCAAVLVLLLAALPPVEAAEVLNGVKSRGQLRCGVSEDVPGFSERDANGYWRGLQVDFCRAVAAAVLNDPERVDFVPLQASARFPALQTRRIDLLLANTTWTLTREAVLRVRFPGILFYDGQGFMVTAAAKIATLADLDGATICVEKGTTHQRTLEAYFKAKGRSVKPLLMASAQKTAAAFFAGQCQAYTADAGELAAMRLRAPGDSGSFVILPERISREPLSPVVWSGDPEWATVIRWVLNILILGEEYGVTRDRLDEEIKENRNPLLRQDPYEGKIIAQALGIEPQWGIRALRAVGNYAEIYERNVGPNSPLKIERGLNRLWTNGGLHYSPPID